MFLSFFKSIFGTKNDRVLKKYGEFLSKVNSLEFSLFKLSDSELKNKFFLLKNSVNYNNIFYDILPNAYSIVREISSRVLHLRHYDVQILAGIAIYDNKIIEVATGEGKTLVATLPACLWSLLSKSVHIITVNDYLARRDANWMMPIYNFLDINVGILSPSMSILERKKAYDCSIVYGTCSEFGFDYLRDNLVLNMSDKVQSELNCALLDEVDSILIDEARTPLIISSPERFDSGLYIKINNIAMSLSDGFDFVLDEKNKHVQITEIGFSKLEELFRFHKLLKIEDNLYDINNINLLHDVYSALKANYLFKRDIDYIIKDGLILIIDEHTGRILDGRRWSDGIHQAVEAKEKVDIHSENQVLAMITFQNYFRLYKFLSGMTGTAYTEFYEFNSIYGLDVVVIPTNKRCIRLDYIDLIFVDKKSKFKYILDDIKKCYERGQPVLVGTVSIFVSEFLSDILVKSNVSHNVLNAKNHEKESQIVAEAGKFKSVTIATNMAGRGTDIVLGGKNSNTDQYLSVVKLGGLKVIGTERHESRRIDNQLRGRCGRQGDPGCTQFYLSLEDDLIRIFIGDKFNFLLNKFKLSNDEIISHKLVNKAIENAQRRVESHNFDIRKQLLEFDDIFNEQRVVFYNYRNFLIFSESISLIVDSLFREVVFFFFNKNGFYNFDNLNEELCLNILNLFNFDFGTKINNISSYDSLESLGNFFISELKFLYNSKKQALSSSVNFCFFEKVFFLNVLDSNWKWHLLDLEYLKKGIHLRGYAHQDPKNEYKKESFLLFENMLITSKYDFFLLFLKFPIDNILNVNSNFEFDKLILNRDINILNKNTKIGRNSMCYCNSGKKYKYCHGK